MIKWLSCLFVASWGALSAFYDPARLEEEPWFSGTLLAPVTSVVKAGNIVLQPYLNVICQKGVYSPQWTNKTTPDFWVVNPNALLVFGLTEWMDVEMVPQVLWQETRGRSFVGPGDLLVGCDFQLYEGTKTSFPSVLLTLGEIFPVGNYQRLDPRKLQVDATGLGAFVSEVSITLYKQYALRNGHYMSAAFGVIASFPSHVHVNGYNAYGGSGGTQGIVHPGNYFTTILSFEYTLTQNWILAFDTEYIHNDANRFRGTTEALVGSLSRDQINCAPAIEYSFSKRMGLVAGAYFSAFGRNSARFCGGIITLSYVYPP